MEWTGQGGFSARRRFGTSRRSPIGLQFIFARERHEALADFPGGRCRRNAPSPCRAPAQHRGRFWENSNNHGCADIRSREWNHYGKLRI